MTRSRPMLAIAVLALMAGSGSLPAQQAVGAVYGAVTDTDGNKLPGVTLTLTGFGELKIQTSNNLGDFRFLGLDPGVWSLEAKLDGFSTVDYSTINIEASRSTTLAIELTAAIEEVITVTAESPLLDERKLSTGTTLRQVELDKLPVARDPWAVLTQSPGVLVNRVDVGGAKGAQQPLFRGMATITTQNDYLLDGMQVTDNQVGATTFTYYDLDQIEELQVLTGGNDVTKNTSGVAISLVTKRGSNEMRGSARFLLTEGDGYFGALEQAEPGFDPDGLGPGQENFVGDSIDRLQDYGFEAGGPAWRDHVWLWGAWSQRDFSTVAGNAEPTLFILDNTAIKVNAQLAQANSLVASYNNSEKRGAGRSAGPGVDRSATQNQSGPHGITKIEDSHIFGSTFFLTAGYNYVEGDLDLVAVGGEGPDRPPIPDPGGEKNRDASGFLTNTSTERGSSQQEEIKLDASYFLNTGAVSHEIRFGGRLRESNHGGTFTYPGRNLIHYAGNLFGVQNPGLLAAFGLPPERFRDAHIVYASRGLEPPTQIDETGIWAQDTLTWSRWTVNAGLRYDLQEAENLPATVEANGGFPGLMPPLEFPGNDAGGFSLRTLSPRLGVTYALGQERKTLLRGSLSQFPEIINHLGQVQRTNPLDIQQALILFLDDPGGFPAFYDQGETFTVLGGIFGFDPSNPTALSTSNITDPDVDPGVVTELVLGVEHAFLPEFVAGLNLTWRDTEDIGDFSPLFEDRTTGEIRTAGADEYVFDGRLVGQLPDGSRYAYDTFAANPNLVPSGGNLWTTGERTAEAFAVSITLTKRLSNRWMARGFINYVLEDELRVPASYFESNDPNRVIFSIDGIPPGGGLDSKWQWNLNGMYQVAPERRWGFNVAANFTGRQGYPIRYLRPTVGSDGIRRSIVVVEGVRDFRYGDLFLADLRLEKEFAASGNTSLTFSIDAFNVFNDGTVLDRNTNVNATTVNWVEATVSPRVFRLGVRLNWR